MQTSAVFVGFPLPPWSLLATHHVIIEASFSAYELPFSKPSNSVDDERF
jgi:hypothetical protein